jgi:CheY-like chemotaxis protein
VLLVEDSPEMGIIVAALARRGGYRVVCRQDVAGAWEFLQATKPDLILLDLQLPGPGGLELLRRLQDRRRESLRPAPPVALFGHWNLPEQVAAALEAGVDFVVSKDLVSRPDAWQQRLDNILSAEDGQSPAQRLGWTEGRAGAPPEDWPQRVHAALRHSDLRCLGSETVRLVLGRALQCCLPAAGRTPARDLADILRGDQVTTLVVALAQEVWRLLGSEAGLSFWKALAAVVPDNSDLLAR